MCVQVHTCLCRYLTICMPICIYVCLCILVSVCVYRADDESSGSAATNVVLRYNGEITWDSPAITKSSCVVDVSFFPFDWQQCNLTFGSWTYNGNQVETHTLT